MGCRVYSYTRFYLAKIVFYMRRRLFLYGILLIYCQALLSRPVFSVQIAITDGFSQMGGCISPHPRRSAMYVPPLIYGRMARAERLRRSICISRREVLCHPAEHKWIITCCSSVHCSRYRDDRHSAVPVYGVPE